MHTIRLHHQLRPPHLGAPQACTASPTPLTVACMRAQGPMTQFEATPTP
jgi:hypothetical protein